MGTVVATNISELLSMIIYCKQPITFNTLKLFLTLKTNLYANPHLIKKCSLQFFQKDFSSLNNTADNSCFVHMTSSNFFSSKKKLTLFIFVTRASGITPPSKGCTVGKCSIKTFNSTTHSDLNMRTLHVMRNLLKGYTAFEKDNAILSPWSIITRHWTWTNPHDILCSLRTFVQWRNQEKFCEKCRYIFVEINIYSYAL